MPRGTHDFSKGRRLIALIDFRPRSGRRKCDLTSKKDDQSLRGQAQSVPTSHGITLSRHDVLEAPYTRRASPLLAGLSTGITSSSGNSFRFTRQGISLP